jgi:Fur family transcriptional regulator, zinc uptake regulator
LVKVLCYISANGKPERYASAFTNQTTLGSGARRHAVRYCCRQGYDLMAKKRIGKTKQDWATQVGRACAASGLQLTTLRRQVLEIIAKAPAPLGAYAIIDAMSRAQDKQVAPPTVYRTLEFFLEHGFLHKIESRNAYAPCEHLGHRHHGILLICEICGRTDEVESASLGKLLKDIAARNGFSAQSQMVEVEGLCKTCQNAAATPKDKISSGEALDA